VSAALLLTALAHGTVWAQPPSPQPAPPQPASQPGGPLSSQLRLNCGENTPDVILDVPQLTVEEITLEVERLQAHLDLDARVASLVQLRAGVDVVIDGVTITIKGVQAQLLLVVCLENVRQILDRVIALLEQNPDILNDLVGGVTNLLSQTLNDLGQTVLTFVTQTGDLVERILGGDGAVLGQNVVGNVLSLPVLSETTNAAGQTVRRVQGPSGSVIEVILDQAGNILSTRVVTQAVGRS
jgi:hypothetical protein